MSRLIIFFPLLPLMDQLSPSNPGLPASSNLSIFLPTCENIHIPPVNARDQLFVDSVWAEYNCHAFMRGIPRS